MAVRSSKARVALAALFLPMVTACGAESERGAVQAPASSAPPAVCADPINDPGHCAFELKDSARRTSVPAIGESESLDEAAVAVFNTARGGGCLEELDSSGTCAGEAVLEATEEYVTRVQRALIMAGYTDAVVRLGRAEDPTVPGALLWAVRVGDVCVFGDIVPGPDRRWHEWYAGLLPDGRCLIA
ncbi:hypothetical protein [Actinoplanes aureus]|uniref:Lipoprotein n=1 Tax=Actinoplanes aureus TaxID=2792083 RepID=A0A931CAF4_9ACTN|nr:hypothetical protein [Actinoplanes aureus]MBG0563498.1 hypothetical protein [Actinoplanes aureus]